MSSYRGSVRTGKTGVFYYESTERSDRCYYITYKIGSVKKREKIGWKSEGYSSKTASDIRAKRIQQLRHGRDVVYKISFKEGADKYLSFIKDKPSYIDIKRYLELAASFFGYSSNLASITSIQILEYIDHLRNKRNSATGKHLSDQTVVHHYKAVRQMYNYIADIGLYTGQNPLTKQTRLALPRVNNTTINYLKEDEMKNMLIVLNNYQDKMLSNFFLFAIYTGIRLSEILDLKKEHINMDKHLVLIPASSAKSKCNEVVELSDIAMDIVNSQLQLIKSNNILTEYIFCNRDGSKRREVKVQFATLKRKAGINRPFRFHDLRHNFATMLIDSGADLYTVQMLLNHKDPKTTQKYAHFKTGKLKQAVNKAFDMSNQ